MLNNVNFKMVTVSSKTLFRKYVDMSNKHNYYYSENYDNLWSLVLFLIYIKTELTFDFFFVGNIFFIKLSLKAA